MTAAEDIDGDGVNDLLHDNTDIMLTFSDDGGATWRVPLQVNDDNGLTPSSTGFATRNSQFFPTMSVDPITGILHISWLDARLDPNNQQVDVFYTTAVPDRITGDLTFPNPNVRVTNIASNEAGGTRNPAFNLGDYCGIVVANAIAHPVDRKSVV